LLQLGHDAHLPGQDRRAVTGNVTARTRRAALALLLAMAACGGTSAPNPPIKPGDASQPPMSMMPPNNFDALPPSGSVSILFRSPAPPPSPKSVLSTNSSAEVRARVAVMDGTDLIDPSSVRMSLIDASGAVLSSGPMVGPMGDNEYRGNLSLAGLRTGEYKITITARSTGNLQGSASLDVSVDGGPIITVLSPVPGKHYKGALIVQLAVEPGAAGLMGMPEVTIAGMPVAIASVGSNQFRGMVDLTMPVLLMGDQIFVVTARNGSGTRSELRFIFNVDVTGPAITETKPIPGEIVGGIVKISAKVIDDGGVNESSIQALVGDKTTPQFKLALTRESGSDTFSVLFDTKLLTGCKLSTDLCIVRPTVSFRASDLLGNDAAVSYEFAVDNIPPVADLVPPPIYVWRRENGFRCSHGFDPLQHHLDKVPGDAPDDLCQVPQMFDLRARIQDVGNHAKGLKQQPISTVDPDKTAVYVLDTTVLDGQPQPLVVDTDGDEYCDALNPRLEPTTLPLTGPRQVLKIRMRPVPPGGLADFYTPDPNLPAGCLPGIAPDPPKYLCPLGPQPTIAISYAGLPAIWAIEPIAPPDPAYCFGGQLDTLANNVTAVRKPNTTPLPAQTGWKCVAVVTADKNGNASTSAPIRVYLDDYGYGGSNDFCKPAPASAGAPPSCTGTYDKATGAVTQKACKTRSFKPPAGFGPELCENGDCGFWDEFL
jgi:hypothetical protein